MAFIRSYMVRSRMMAGDPLFGIKLPKIKVGKLLGGVAGTALSLTPAGRVANVLKIAGKAVGMGAAAGIGSRLVQSIPMPSFQAQPGTGAFNIGSNRPATEEEKRMGRAAFEGAYVRSHKRYRRMNVTNMRALTRAVRRVKRFEKIARQTVTLSHRVRVKKGARGR